MAHARTDTKGFCRVICCRIWGAALLLPRLLANFAEAAPLISFPFESGQIICNTPSSFLALAFPSNPIFNYAFRQGKSLALLQWQKQQLQSNNSTITHVNTEKKTRIRSEILISCAQLPATGSRKQTKQEKNGAPIYQR